MRIDAEPAGANCATGGSAIHGGLDTDMSGTLEDTEITSTSYVCNGTNGGGGGGVGALFGRVRRFGDATNAGTTITLVGSGRSTP